MSMAYALKLSNRLLTQLLNNLEGEFQQAILESITEMKFVGVGRPPDHFHFDEYFDLSQWHRGRTFGTEMELRWRSRNSHFLCLIVGESPLLLSSILDTEITSLTSQHLLDRFETFQVRLWGDWQDTEKQWYEEQIPKLLFYPFRTSEKHPAIRVARYHVREETKHAGEERNSIYRFVGIEGLNLVEQDSELAQEKGQ